MDAFTRDRVRRLVVFLGCILLAAGITFFIKEPTFTDSQVYVLFLLFFAIGLWLSEIMPAFAVSLIIISFLVFALGNEHLNSAPENIDKYVHTFSSSVIWLMLGGFFLASAMTKTKLDEAIFRFTINMSGDNPKQLLLGLMFTTMVASTMMSNAAITAMMIAAVTPLLKSLEKGASYSKALLLGIPTAATTGGLATIIGTPTNAIAVGILENVGVHVSFMDWMIFGLPLTLILTAISWYVLVKLFVKNDTNISLSFLKEITDVGTKEFQRQRKVVIVVVILTVALWLTSSLHGVSVAGVCAVPLVLLTLTRVIDGKDVRNLPWDTLLLIAGGLSLGLAMGETGLLNYYAQMLISMKVNSILLICIFGYFTMMVSNVMSGTAASSVMIPMGIVILINFQIEVALVMALSASAALFLPVSSPANATAFSTGFLDQKDFKFMGLLIGILCPLLAIVWVLFVA